MEINKELYEKLKKEFEKDDELVCGCEALSFEDFLKYRLAELKKKEK